MRTVVDGLWIPACAGMTGRNSEFCTSLDWVAHYELVVLSLSGRMDRTPVTWSHEVSSMKKVR